MPSLRQWKDGVSPLRDTGVVSSVSQEDTGEDLSSTSTHWFQQACGRAREIFGRLLSGEHGPA